MQASSVRSSGLAQGAAVLPSVARIAPLPASRAQNKVIKKRAQAAGPSRQQVVVAAAASGAPVQPPPAAKVTKTTDPLNIVFVSTGRAGSQGAGPEAARRNRHGGDELRMRRRQTYQTGSGFDCDLPHRTHALDHAEVAPWSKTGGLGDGEPGSALAVPATPNGQPRPHHEPPASSPPSPAAAAPAATAPAVTSTRHPHSPP